MLRTGGYSLGMPTSQPIDPNTGKDPHGGSLQKSLMSGLLVLPANRLTQDTARCELPTLGTAGNTSVCLVVGPVDTWGKQPPSGTCNSSYAPTYIQRFALFSPQFGRRPYVREKVGAVVMLTDYSLIGTELAFKMSIAGKTFTANVSGGANISIPFDLSPLPASHAEDVTLELTLPGGVVVNHTRRFLRSPPPQSGSPVITWQVDHETKGLLVDGVPFLAAGWFGSGGIHEAAGPNKAPRAF